MPERIEGGPVPSFDYQAGIDVGFEDGEVMCGFRPYVLDQFATLMLVI